MAVRSLTLLGLDDLVAVVREFINPDVSRSGLIAACVAMAWPICVNYKPRRWLMPARLSHRSKPSGIMNLASCTWISYLPRMPDEKQRRYLFVAIDRATRWVFMHIYADQSEQSSVDF